MAAQRCVVRIGEAPALERIGPRVVATAAAPPDADGWCSLSLHAGEITAASIPAGYELDVAQHVRKAVEIAGARRIGHGVDVLEESDPMGLLDTRYRWGGRGPATGFDCSGLVSHVFLEAAGMRVKGSSAELGQKVRPVPPEQLLPGDLVFFNTLGARHSHVGVYVGDGRFVHASNPRTGVRIDQLSNRYYAQRFEGAGSLLD